MISVLYSRGVGKPQNSRRLSRSTKMASWWCMQPPSLSVQFSSNAQFGLSCRTWASTQPSSHSTWLTSWVSWHFPHAWIPSLAFHSYLGEAENKERCNEHMQPFKVTQNYPQGGSPPHKVVAACRERLLIKHHFYVVISKTRHDVYNKLKEKFIKTFFY
jgi:hypothetical protein